VSALKKITSSIAALFSEGARARQVVEQAEAAVREAQGLFDASPSQAAGDNLMAKKRELEHAKLFVERAERLGAAERAKELEALADEKRQKLAELEAVADDQAVTRDIRELFYGKAKALEALAELDRDVLKRVRAAMDATDQAERLRAQLEQRPYDRQRVQGARAQLAAREALHAQQAADYVAREGLINNLRWLGRL